MLGMIENKFRKRMILFQAIKFEISSTVFIHHCSDSVTE